MATSTRTDLPPPPTPPRPPRRFLPRFLAFLLVLGLLFAGYLWVMLKWSYSTGERAGWVQKLSKKGWLCKTWEGELALVSLPGSTAEKFYFTIRDDAIAEKLAREVGKRVSLHYEEKVGLPTTCFGETRHYVTGYVEMQDVPMGPGLSYPQGGVVSQPMPQPMPQAAPQMQPAPMAPPQMPAPAQAPAVAPPAAPAPVMTPGSGSLQTAPS